MEQAFEYSHSKAALILLTGYQTPTGCTARLETWLRKRKARNAAAIAAAAIEAANAPHTMVPGQTTAAAIVARLAKEVMALTRNRRHQSDDRRPISPPPPRRDHLEHARIRCPAWR